MQFHPLGLLALLPFNLSLKDPLNCCASNYTHIINFTVEGPISQLNTAVMVGFTSRSLPYSLVPSWFQSTYM